MQYSQPVPVMAEGSPDCLGIAVLGVVATTFMIKLQL